MWFYLFGYNSEKINKANSKINSNIKSGKKSLSGDFYFNLTVGLATAGDSLLFLISIIISCICRPWGCCRRARGRGIYGHQQDDDKLITCVNGAGVEMALVKPSTSPSVKGASAHQTNQQPAKTQIPTS